MGDLDEISRNGWRCLDLFLFCPQVGKVIGAVFASRFLPSKEA